RHAFDALVFASGEVELGGLARITGDHREAIAFSGFLHNVL
ncbi:hypothetical protein HMPREF0004_4091, partial [Achromobacter piechaudii ATCC 43553]